MVIDSRFYMLYSQYVCYLIWGGGGGGGGGGG